MSSNKQQDLNGKCLNTGSREVAETGEIENRPEIHNSKLGFHERGKQMTEPGKISTLTILPPYPSSKVNTEPGYYTLHRKTRSEWKLQNIVRWQRKQSKREKGWNMAWEKVQNDKIQCLQSIDRNLESSFSYQFLLLVI